MENQTNKLSTNQKLIVFARENSNILEIKEQKTVSSQSAWSSSKLFSAISWLALLSETSCNNDSCVEKFQSVTLTKK